MYIHLLFLLHNYPSVSPLRDLKKLFIRDLLRLETYHRGTYILL